MPMMYHKVYEKARVIITGNFYGSWNVIVDAAIVLAYMNFKR